MTRDAALQEPQPQQLPLRERLRTETRAEHQAIERALDLMRPDFSLDDYRALLLRHYGFHLPFERMLESLAREGLSIARFYQDERRKAAWLAEDLRALGVESMDDAACVPVERLQAMYRDRARLLGAVYVIEGSMLGGAVLARRFAASFDLSTGRGLRFFTGYGDLAGRKWNETLRLLQSPETARLPSCEVVAGARATFLLLSEQLTGTEEMSLPSTSEIRSR